MPSELEKFAAHVKTAIQYQSPKMQQILQGALDQAWQAGRGVRHPPGIYRDRLARESLRDPVKGNARYNAFRERPDAKLIERTFSDGGGPVYTTLPPMSKTERTRQLIFGAGDRGVSARRRDNLPRSWRYALRGTNLHRTPESLPPSWRDTVREAYAGLYMPGLRGEIESLRMGWVHPNFARKLNDPRIQRVIEHQAPGGVEQLRKHMLAVQGEGPVPAFDIKKLRGG